MLDPSIPLQGLLINRNDEMLKQEQIRAHRMRNQQAQEEGHRRQRLSELLPGAVRGDRAAIDEMAGVDPEMFMRLDEHERAIAKAKTADLTQAVRWADTPEKWEQVIQHYAQEGVDLTPYSGKFDQRERAMLELGKIGEYLESAPKPEFKSVEAGGSLIDVSGGNPRVVIAPNDGTQQMGQPVRQAGGPQPGQVVRGFRFKGGNPNDRNSWEPVNGGPTPQASGGFPSAGY